MTRNDTLNKNMAGRSANDTKFKPKILVAGDNSKDRFIYLEGFPDKPANLRDAWVNAIRFWTADLDGGAGALRQYLMAMGIDNMDPCPENDVIAESMYALTRKKDKKGQRWCVGQAVTAGECDYSSGELAKCFPEILSNETPAVIIDFNQGWLKKNKNMLHDFLQNRFYIIRTHDPRKEEWRNIRQEGIKMGIWVSPIQDMADGSLWFPGNWESLCERLLGYLQADDTLWRNGKWLQYVVIQISYDGAFVVGPEIDEKGELLIFKGDQPDSFSREDYGIVVAGGIVFVYSLTQALLSSSGLDSSKILDCVRTGLARIRKVVIEGYDGPPEGQTDWSPPKTTNLPIKSLETPETDDIITYNMTPPEGNWDTACAIVCGNEDKLREKTVFRLGELITSCPEYAHTLLCLISRIENHVNSGKGVFSFSIFGGPGSGKSFVARRTAIAVDPAESKFERVTFNLSQFNEPARLVDAFKQIQTIGLRGKIPFVTWDEFDTFYNGKQAGWLSSFLMPMEDANFFDGMTSRALGKCVFVFVGGTFEDERDFREWASKDEGKELKAPDFHSRQDSSLTVPSLDLVVGIDESIKRDDPAKLVRAIAIRRFLNLERHKERLGKIKSISQEVLAFLLHVPLRHGMRSLERIITASELSKTTCFQIFHLAPLDVLQLHVDESKMNPYKSVMDFIDKIKLDFYQKPPLELEWRK